MFSIHYSEDRGLLENKIFEFKQKNLKVIHLRRCTFSELELNLFQVNTSSESLAFVVDDYLDSLDSLSSVLKSLDSSVEIIVLFTNHFDSKNVEFLNLFSNSDKFLEELNHKTKRGYINTLVKSRKFKIDKTHLDVIKNTIPARAIYINELLENVYEMQKMGVLDDRSLRLYLSTFRDVNFFSFLEIYLKDSDFEWFRFLDENVVCSETFNKFTYSFSYKLLELKRGSVSENKDFPFWLYSSMLKKFGEKLNDWLNSFIIETYFFYSETLYSREITMSLLKFFLLRKKLDLFNGG